MDSPPQKETPHEKIVRETREQYEAFNRFVSVQKGDGWLIATGKILLRIVGIAFMIALSPFVLIGLFLAFVAVF
jgi:hypothetical protein